jgi:hypothetical protein
VNKSDEAIAAAQDVREQAFQTGMLAAELIAEIAPDYSVKAHVVESWLLKNGNFESLEMFDQAVATSRKEADDNEARRLERAKQRELKFRELGEIIDSIPPKGVWWAMLNVVGSATSQSWRNWIKRTCQESETERDDAFTFAKARMRARLIDEKLDNAPNK